MDHYHQPLIKRNHLTFLFLTDLYRVEMCGTKKIILYRDQDRERDQKKHFSRTRDGTEKKLPRPGPNKKSYRDLDRDRDQKTVGPAHL
jgi:hypothetical protein